MKKWQIIALAIILVGSIATSIAWAQQDENAQFQPKTSSKPTEKQLTESQKKELADLYAKISDLKKQIVDKYVEFGIIDDSRAELIKQKIDKIEKFMAEQGYLPKLGRSKFKEGLKSKMSTDLKGKRPIRQNPSQPAKNSQ